MKIIVLYKGFSAEKEVSEVSGNGIATSLQENKHIVELIDPASFSSYKEMLEKIKSLNYDIVFNALHGGDGENGKIQALLELENIPFTGSDYKTSSIAMNKYVCSRLVSTLKIPIPKNVILFDKDNYDKKEILQNLSFPMIIKPNDAGSSFGVSIVKKEEELFQAIKDAFAYSEVVICEEYIKGRELTVSILEDKALPVVEISPFVGFYDYKNKYTKGCSKYTVPAVLSKEEENMLKNYSIKIAKFIKTYPYARIDFRYDNENFYFLEVNSLPGMTPLSLSPMAAKEAGLTYYQFIEKIIACSLSKWRNNA